ncbi:MAG: ATP-binding protein, partial [Sphingobacteriales bacterium]
FIKMLQEVLASGKTVSGTIPAQTLINGQLQLNYYEYEYRAIKNDAGKTYCILHTAVDVTEQVIGKQAVDRELEKEIALAREQMLNEELSVSNEELRVANDELKLTQDNLRLLNDELEERVESRTRDLSESEVRFRTMAESSGILIAVSDNTRNYIYFNKAWLNLTGKPLADLAGFGWTDLIHPDDKENFMAVYLSSFKVYHPFSVEFRILDDENNYRWLMCNGFPRFTFDHIFVGYVSSSMDITDLKMLEQRKDDFISIASHELKTPLTGLKATLQLLDRMKEKPDANSLIKLIVQANRSMDKISILVNDLLSFSRTMKGAMPLNKSVFKLADMVDKCCNHARIEGKYDLILSGDKDLQVCADETRIDQVMVNLVNNAVKYAPQSREIFIKIDKLDQEVKVSVKDTGPGIPDDKLPHLFERYYRVSYNGEHYSGLGLGLFISSEIIKRHGGKIGVESVLGEGTTFWFTLPFYPGEPKM